MVDDGAVTQRKAEIMSFLRANPGPGMMYLKGMLAAKLGLGREPEVEMHDGEHDRLVDSGHDDLPPAEFLAKREGIGIQEATALSAYQDGLIERLAQKLAETESGMGGGHKTPDDKIVPSLIASMDRVLRNEISQHGTTGSIRSH